MPQITLGLGVALVALGLIGYLATGMASWTALIPSFFGVPFLILGGVAMKESARKHAMHAAAVFALLAVLGSASRVPGFFRLIAGGEVERPAAAIASTIMATLCVVFLVLCIRSFINARRQQAAQPAAE